MDRDEIENWGKIKAHMEAVGNTDNFYYRRACAILSGQSDPMQEKLPRTDEDPS